MSWWKKRGFLRQQKYSVWYLGDGYMSYILAKPLAYTTARVNPKVSDGLWVIMISMYHSGGWCEEGSYAWVSAGEIWQSSVPFSVAAIALNFFLKKKSLQNWLKCRNQKFSSVILLMNVGRDAKLLNHFSKACLEFNKSPTGEGGKNWLPKRGRTWILLGILMRPLNRWLDLGKHWGKVMSVPY